MRLPREWLVLGLSAAGLASEHARETAAAKDAFLDGLMANLTVRDLAVQLHLMFADNIVGPASDNALYGTYVAAGTAAGAAPG